MDDNYVTHYLELHRRHWWWRARHSLVMKTVRQVLADRDPQAPRPRILDIGCAGGVTFDDLHTYGDVYGLEPNRELAEAFPRWRDRVERTEFGPDYSGRERFDLILMLDVLEHIEDDHGAALRLAQMLNPGGSVLLTVPALPSLWSVHDEVNRHFRRYTRKSLGEVLQGAGLEPQRNEYFYSWSLGLLYLRRWLTRGAQRDSYRVQIPPALVNEAMRLSSLAEQTLFRLLRTSPPLGSSILAVARCPEPQPARSADRLSLSAAG